MDNYNNYINKQSVMKRYDVAMKGGNAEKGKGIFFGHAQAQCSKCHALKQIDKQIGPSLEGIAKRHSRKFLLQSIVDPQAEITLGYGIVTAKLNDNRIVSGTLLSKDKNRITIKLPNNSLEYFATSEIKSLSKPVGTMPDPQSYTEPTTSSRSGCLSRYLKLTLIAKPKEKRYFEESGQRSDEVH